MDCAYGTQLGSTWDFEFGCGNDNDDRCLISTTPCPVALSRHSACRDLGCACDVQLILSALDAVSFTILHKQPTSARLSPSIHPAISPALLHATPTLPSQLLLQQHLYLSHSGGLMLTSQDLSSRYLNVTLVRQLSRRQLGCYGLEAVDGSAGRNEGHSSSDVLTTCDMRKWCKTLLG